MIEKQRNTDTWHGGDLLESTAVGNLLRFKGL